jgi:dephospho-CoA kinase
MSAQGKTTVSSYLGSHHAIPIIDADLLAREVIDPGTAGYKAVVAHFGKSVLQSDGINLDRSAISNIVFANEKERRALNAIVHPAVRKAMAWRVLRLWLEGHWACILDVPLLIEAGLDKWVGEVVVVYVCVCPPMLVWCLSFRLILSPSGTNHCR